jgi:sporulation protein YabP
MDNTSPEQKKQNLTLESRKHLSIDGVKDIKSFDDLLVCLETNMGKMNVEGKQLKISKYLCNTGEMTIDGIIDAVIYFEDSQEKKSFFSRLAR